MIYAHLKHGILFALLVNKHKDQFSIGNKNILSGNIIIDIALVDKSASLAKELELINFVLNLAYGKQ